jgi:hypothetical protein
MSETTTPIDYEAIDPAVRRLCRVLNNLPGIRTVHSCQGFIDGLRPGLPWIVSFELDRHPQHIAGAVDSLEWLTSIIDDFYETDEGDVGFDFDCPPIEGRRPLRFHFCSGGIEGVPPDLIAEAIEAARMRRPTSDEAR